MRTFILVALGALLLGVVGWITFSRDGTKTSINLETSQIKRDAHQMLNSGSKMVRDVKESVAEPTKPQPESSPLSRRDDTAMNSVSPSTAGTIPPQTLPLTRTAGPTPPSNEQR